MFHAVFSEGDPRIDELASSIPVGRVGRPDDVARSGHVSGRSAQWIHNRPDDFRVRRSEPGFAGALRGDHE